MDMLADVHFVTTNYNSSSYMPVAVLSLYSIFKAAEKLAHPARILLVDSASTDGSFEKLRDLGVEMSKRTGIEFTYIRLSRDLGNSFALAYGFLHAKKEQAKYVVTVDNDFVVIDFDAVARVLNTMDALLKSGFKVYSVAGFHLELSREYLSEKYRVESLAPDSLEYLHSNLSELATRLRSTPVVSNICYVDVLGRPFPTPQLVPLGVYKKLLDALSIHHKVFITAYVASTFAVCNASCAPIIPYLYIYGDDQLTGMEHARRGYLNLVVPCVVGIHFSTSRAKIGPRKAYFTARNYMLVNSIERRSVRLLHHLVGFFHYALVSPLLNLASIKNPLKRAHVKLIDDNLFGSNVKDTLVIKSGILGSIHGFMYDRKFRSIVEAWFNRYSISKAGDDLLRYTLMNLERWSEGGMLVKDALLLIYPGPRAIKTHKEVRILIRRLVTYKHY